jgi:hypothetical protein
MCNHVFPQHPVKSFFDEMISNPEKYVDAFFSEDKLKRQPAIVHKKFYEMLEEADKNGVVLSVRIPYKG